jgi:hypothetical protein
VNKLDREKKKIRERILKGKKDREEGSEELSKRIKKGAGVSKWGFKEDSDGEGGEDTDKE